MIFKNLRGVALVDDALILLLLGLVATGAITIGMSATGSYTAVYSDSAISSYDSATQDSINAALSDQDTLAELNSGSVTTSTGSVTWQDFITETIFTGASIATGVDVAGWVYDQIEGGNVLSNNVDITTGVIDYGDGNFYITLSSNTSLGTYHYEDIYDYTSSTTRFGWNAALCDSDGNVVYSFVGINMPLSSGDAYGVGLSINPDTGAYTFDYFYASNMRTTSGTTSILLGATAEGTTSTIDSVGSITINGVDYPVDSNGNVWINGEPYTLNDDGTLTYNGETYYPTVAASDIIDQSAILDLLNQIVANDDVSSDTDTDTDTSDYSGILGKLYTAVQQIRNYLSTLYDKIVDYFKSATASATITIDNYKLSESIIEVFPFCLPWDFVKAVELFTADPVVPAWSYTFYIPSFGNYAGYNVTIDLDMAVYEDLALICRWLSSIAFATMLIFVSTKIVKGAGA